jgi:hypothetical protein
MNLNPTEGMHDSGYHVYHASHQMTSYGLCKLCKKTTGTHITGTSTNSRKN